MTLDAAVQRGVKSLQALQERDGSFPFLELDREGGPRECHRLFSTTAVLLACGTLLPATCTAQAIDYVLSCRRDDGMWHFDPSLPIPADADDTACALACTAIFRRGAITRDDAALLRSYWRPDGGPFRTWHGDDPAWLGRERDDPVVNANVLFALRVLDANPTLPEVAGITRFISAHRERARYYVAPVSIAYAAVRAGIARRDLSSIARARPPGDAGALVHAQWLCSLPDPDPRAGDHLRSLQRHDGSWPAEPWCTDNARAWGSAAVSTALCVEALHRLGSG